MKTRSHTRTLQSNLKQLAVILTTFHGLLNNALINLVVCCHVNQAHFVLNWLSETRVLCRFTRFFRFHFCVLFGCLFVGLVEGNLM